MTKISNVILVHGAWADGSSWAKVIPLLEKSGLHVTAVQLPLNDYQADVAAVNRALDLQDGASVLVGHSYGGSVVTQAGNHEKVASVVYVDAFAPDAGESAGSIFAQFESAPLGAAIRPDAQGFLSLSREGIFNVFAQDLRDDEKAIVFATQGPINGTALGGVVSQAAWRSKPSWYLIGDQDQAILRVEQEKMAARIGATVRHVDSSHVPMFSKPDDVAAIIVEAAS